MGVRRSAFCVLPVLPAIPQLLQVGFDGFLQLCGFGKLLVQLSDKAGHLFGKRLAVIFDRLGSDVSAGGEDVAVACDLLGGGGFAETRYVGVGAATFVAAPGVVGADDLVDVGLGQLTVDAIDERAEFAASMNRVSLLRLRRCGALAADLPCPRARPDLLRVRNHRHTGICVE